MDVNITANKVVESGCVHRDCHENAICAQDVLEYRNGDAAVHGFRCNDDLHASSLSATNPALSALEPVVNFDDITVCVAQPCSVCDHCIRCLQKWQHFVLGRHHGTHAQ